MFDKRGLSEQLFQGGAFFFREPLIFEPERLAEYLCKLLHPVPPPGDCIAFWTSRISSSAGVVSGALSLSFSCALRMSWRMVSLEFQIYLCNWKQTTYEEQEDEMKSIRLIFKEIRNLIFDATEKKFDCDSILEFSCEDIILINEVCSKVKLLLDGDTNIKKIEFVGREVEVIL